jgi:hypothetical protein
VNADAAFGHYVLAPRLGDFLALYPELTMELVVRDRIGDLAAEPGRDATSSGSSSREAKPSPSTCRAGSW